MITIDNPDYSNIWEKVKNKILESPQELNLKNPASEDFDLTFAFICSILSNLKKGGPTGPFRGYFKQEVLTEIDNPEEFFSKLLNFALLN